MTFDSRPDTQKHIDRVKDFMAVVRDNLTRRAAMHDASKLVEPELPYFDVATERLATLVYGSPEYKASLAELKPALEHHYKHNDHHPEHHPNGVAGMSLMALLEMLCDWRAASERTKQRMDDPEKVATFESGLEYNFERFGITGDLATVLRNTVKELGF